MRKIVIPTDFSENAMNALRYAAELFKYEHSCFFIIHVYADEVYNTSTLASQDVFEKLKEMMHKTSDIALEKVCSTIQQVSPNPRHNYTILSKFGNLTNELNDLVNQENIDIIVMGTKGKTNDRKLTFGSNTLQVLKHVNCPLLAIPDNCSYHRPKNILFPTNYLLPFKRRELKLLNTLTKSFRSIIHFLHVSNYNKLSIRQKDNKKFLKTSLPDIELVFHNEDAEDLTAAINVFIRKNTIDFLVMINSRHSYLESILYQSAIDKIGLHIKIPFLAMQNLERS
ncbi:universal stress protein [Aquimarina longa]|uniref:universal stress protein n=1 Tax=Aquimarina longa TaxID=1080221 RepID=UPI000782993A|nr:universal stress protein [Aquimarina longa]